MGPGFQDDLRRFAVAFVALVFVDSEEIQRIAQEAASDAVLQPAPGEYIESCVLLRQPDGVVDGQDGNAGSEANAMGAPGCRHGHDGGGSEGIGGVVMFAEPDRVVAEILCEHDLAEKMFVVFARWAVYLSVIVRVEEQSEFHRCSRSEGWRERTASTRGMTSRAKSSIEFRVGPGSSPQS